MGTRADFYVGRGEGAEWIGSIAWDGYPPGITIDSRKAHVTIDPHRPESIQAAKDAIAEAERPGAAKSSPLLAETEAEYRELVEAFFEGRDDVTRPDMGWPWPWETSHTTDYAYAFDADRVWGSRFGRPWFDASQDEPELEDEEGNEIEAEGPVPVFPDMTDRKNVQIGSKRSGVMLLRVPK